MFFRLYQFGWRLWPVLRLSKRLRVGFEQRLVPKDWAEPVDMWIQAASGGEAYLVVELLKHLVVEGRGGKVLLTTWTSQGKQVLDAVAKELGGEKYQILVRYFPLDSPELMARAVDMAKPKLVVLLETELWPGLMRACQKQKIPVAVLNGRLTSKSVKHYGWLKWLGLDFSKLAPQLITATAPSEIERFKQVFPKSEIHLVPNIKFDRQVSGLEHNLVLPENTVLFASTREQEEDLLLPVLQTLRKAHAEATLIIAPRHLHRVNAWQQKLRRQGWQVKLASELLTAGVDLAQLKSMLVIWDRFGELGQLYAASKAIFVGGSLYPLGGQNFLEPLSLGKIPSTGSYLSNFAFALEDLPETASLLDLGLIKICEPNSLSAALSTQLTCPDSKKQVQVSYGEWVKARQGGARQNIQFILKFLKH